MNIILAKKLEKEPLNKAKGFTLLMVALSLVALGACSSTPDQSVVVEPKQNPVKVNSVEPKGDAGAVFERKVKLTPEVTKKPEAVVAPVVKKKVSKPPVKKVHATKKITAKKVTVNKNKPTKIKTNIVVAPLPKKKAIVETVVVKAPEYKVELEKLPLSIGEYWTLSRDRSVSDQCVLSYSAASMSDGQGDTPVQFIVTHDEVLFKTKSNIDTTYAGTGLTVDDQLQTPIEKLYNDFSIVYKMHYLAVIESLKVGKTALLTLGFWPSWPVTHPYSVSLELGEFAAAQQALMTCLALEKELK